MVGIGKTFGLIGFVALALLAVPSLAGASSFSASDAFFFPVKAQSGYGGLGSLATGLPVDAGITASPDGNYVYVAAGTVSQYGSDGAFVRTFANKQGFVGATSVGTDLTGEVYVLYQGSEKVAKYTANGKYLISWPVTFARAIGVSRGGDVFVLTNFLNAVGEYNSAGKSIGGFVANFPGQFFPWPGGSYDVGIVPESGYDPPYKTDATAITVMPSGDPVLVGDSYQALSDKPPSCNAHSGFDDPIEFANPLVSGEVVRFTPSGTLPAWGWLTGSTRDCFGWQSDAMNPSSVAIDPNTGHVYATSPWDLGVIQADLSVDPYSDQGDQHGRINAYGPPCYAYTCPALEDAEYIASNPPVGATLDCHSNLYMLSNTANGEFVTKFLNQDQGQASSCFNPRFALLPRLTLIHIKPAKIKIGKESVLMGCSGKLCTGTLTLKSASSLCRSCLIAAPRHFRIRPGLQKTLTVRLLPLGRRLLEAHPGFSAHVLAKVKGGRAFAQRTTLQGPASLRERCSFAGTVGGPVDVSGRLLPHHAGDSIAIQYLPPESDGLLVPAVQHNVRIDRAGRFNDRYTLATAGNWTAFASWAGNRTHVPVVSHPCSGMVRKVSTQVTINCPASSSVGSPAQFSGSLSGAPADVPVSVVYEPPSEIPVEHSAGTSNTGSYGDSLTPTAAGTWHVLARYSGDAGHDAAQAACSFTVVPNDFSISVTPSSGSVTPGGSVNTTVNTALTSGTSQLVSLTAAGAPGSVAFSPTTIVTGGSSNVAISAPAGATPGTYAITITGAGPWASHETVYTLTVRMRANLTLSCSADPNRHFISCSGRLTVGGSGIAGAQIKLTYTPPPSSGQSQTVETTSTAAGGSYSDTLNAPGGSLLGSGNWQITARFAGDATHAPASKTQTVAVP